MPRARIHRNRRSLAHSPIPRYRRLFRLGPQAVSVWRGRLTGAISKCGDRRLRTLLYEAANVTLTRYKGPAPTQGLGVRDAQRSTISKARIALARRLATITHAMLRYGTEFESA